MTSVLTRFFGVLLGVGLLCGAGGCGRPSGSFVPYAATVAQARPADVETTVALMERVAKTAGFQMESSQALPPGTIFHATHEDLLLVMGAQVVAGKIHVHVSAMAPKLNQSAAHRKVLADLDHALREAFGDRRAVE
jgi:hypothetical protein